MRYLPSEVQAFDIRTPPAEFQGINWNQEPMKPINKRDTSKIHNIISPRMDDPWTRSFILQHQRDMRDKLVTLNREIARIERIQEKEAKENLC